MSTLGDRKEVREVIETILDASGSSTSDFALCDLKALYHKVESECNSSDDFYLDGDWLPTGEVRIMDSDTIEEKHAESIQDMFEDCYDLDNIPDVLKNNIDWASVAEECKRWDGYGHHFNHYDGQEHESNGFYVFRVN